MSNGDRRERLNKIFPMAAIEQRDEREIRLKCLQLGHEIERSLFGNRPARRQTVIDHARAFVDFVRHNESKDAEE